MPRGRKREPNAKRQVIATRFNESEYRAVKTYAQSKGVPPTTMIHQIVLNHLESSGHPTRVEEHNPNQLTID